MAEFCEGVGRIGLLALLYLAVGIFPLLLIGVALQFVSGRFRVCCAKLFGTRLYVWLTAPGVMLHEFSHALLCVVFHHEITEFVLFSPQKNGNLGWVSHKWDKNSFWQNLGCFFIGIAPLFFGVAAIVFLTLLLLPTEFLTFPDLPESGLAAFKTQFRSTFITLCRVWVETQILSDWKFWLWLYAVIAIGSQITLSRTDLSGTKSAAAALIGLLLLLAIAVALLPIDGVCLPLIAIRCSAMLCGLLFYLLLLFGVLTLLLTVAAKEWS
ncbi:MAG: hypothetical protein LBM70_07810 [Victivallales bacterium]|jgi:hypothetical protein|nr:hypothetical protein [Victivallales bacterium]